MSGKRERSASSREARAEGLIIRHVLEEKPLAQCWREVHPDFPGDDETARNLAYDELQWYKRSHPIVTRRLLSLYGLGVPELIDSLEEMREASLYDRRRVIRSADGEILSDEWTKSDLPDWRTRNAALGENLVLCEHPLAPVSLFTELLHDRGIGDDEDDAAAAEGTE